MTPISWKYLFYRNSGEIAQSFTERPANFEELLESYGLLEVTEGEPFDVFDYYVKDKALVRKPPTKGENYFFDYTSESWEIPVELQLTPEQKAVEIRLERDSKLVNSDWTQLPDVPVDSQAWAAYRQALREVTSQEGFPESVIWPTPPQ